MSRDYAAIFTSVWNNPDWRALDTRLQHGYWMFLTQARLSPCGVLDFIPKRFAGMAHGLTSDEVERLVRDLVATKPKPFLVVDDSTAELLVRTYVRWDGLIKAHRPAKAIAKDFDSITSPVIRQAVLDELRRLHVEHPEYKGWVGIDEESADLMGLIQAPGRPKLEAIA